MHHSGVKRFEVLDSKRSLSCPLSHRRAGSYSLGGISRSTFASCTALRNTPSSGFSALLERSFVNRIHEHDAEHRGAQKITQGFR